MIDTAFINPFSDHAKEVVMKHNRNIDDFNREIDDLVEITTHTYKQKTTSDVIPRTIMQLAVNRFKWFLFRNTEDFDIDDYRYLFNPSIYSYDTSAFHLLCQTIAMVFGSNSHEAKLLVDQQAEIVDIRLNTIDDHTIYDEVLGELCAGIDVSVNNLHWTDIKDVLDVGEINLDELIIKDGKVIIDFDDFALAFADVIEGRTPIAMYNETCGDPIKIKLIKSFIISETRKYIKYIEDFSQKRVEPTDQMKDLASTIRSLQEQLQEIRFSTNNASGIRDDKPVSYNLDLFPPCVRKCMRGIKSGGRNDAIVLFLTPFLSYARLFPGVFKLEGAPIKISSVDPTLEITNNEVIPLIYEAANACSPPLFKDQPQEKININSKLGFGMHEEISPENEGQTSWYTPMSCEKIKLHMPQLCVPNKSCQKIGNPLTYYNRMRLIKSRENSNQNGSTTRNTTTDDNTNGD